MRSTTWVWGAAAMQNETDAYRTLFEHSPVPLWDQDLSLLKKYLDGLRAAGTTDFRKYVQENPQDMYRCAGMVRVLDVNRAAVELFGATSKEQLLNDLPRILGAEARSALWAEIICLSSGKVRCGADVEAFTLDGRKLHLRFAWQVAPSHEDDMSRVCLSLTEIGPRHRDVARGSHEADAHSGLRDDLTGLHSGSAFRLLAEQELRLARRAGVGVMLLFVDIDGMKQMNETHGRAAGDRALRDVADVLCRTFRESDVVARHGGDEFVVLSVEGASEDGGALISRLQTNIERQCRQMPRGCDLAVSVGVATSGKAGAAKLDRLIDEASRRMCAARARRAADAPR